MPSPAIDLNSRQLRIRSGTCTRRELWQLRSTKTRSMNKCKSLHYITHVVPRVGKKTIQILQHQCSRFLFFLQVVDKYIQWSREQYFAICYYLNGCVKFHRWIHEATTSAHAKIQTTFECVFRSLWNFAHQGNCLWKSCHSTKEISWTFLCISIKKRHYEYFTLQSNIWVPALFQLWLVASHTWFPPFRHMMTDDMHEQHNGTNTYRSAITWNR